MNSETHMIDYKALRKINPEAARMIILEYLSSNKGNIASTAKAFGIRRMVATPSGHRL